MGVGAVPGALASSWEYVQYLDCYAQPKYTGAGECLVLWQAT